MKSFSRASVVAAALTLTAWSSAHAQARPAASEIIAKYVTAVGGEAEIRKITSMKQIGALSVPAMGLNATMEMYSAAPNKMATKTSIPGLGEMLQGTNGTVAWDVNPMAGPRLLADKELATTLETADFYGNMLYPADRFASIETVGDTTIAGEKAYTVKMVRKSTMKEQLNYFSATSGLLLGSFSTAESQMGPMAITQSVKEYKKFGGLMFPTRIEQSMGPQQMVITISEVSFNAAPDAAFAIPDQVKPLIKP